VTVEVVKHPYFIFLCQGTGGTQTTQFHIYTATFLGDAENVLSLATVLISGADGTNTVTLQFFDPGLNDLLHSNFPVHPLVLQIDPFVSP